MKNTTRGELIAYILFMISSIAMAFPMRLLEQNPESFDYFWITLVAVIIFYTFFGIIFRFEKKPVVFVCLFPILVIIGLFLLGYDGVGAYYIPLIMTEIIILLCKAKEYYHVLFTKGYVTEREKRLMEKRNKRIVPTVNNHASEFSFDAPISKPYSNKKYEPNYSFDKEKVINLHGETIKFNYDIDPDKSEYVLYLGHEFFNPGDREELFEEYGSDDTSGNIISICDNHVFEDEFSKLYYFDLNDVTKVKLVTEHSDYIGYYFELTFKDDKMHIFYTDDYDMGNIKDCILSARRDLTVINSNLFYGSDHNISIEGNTLKIKNKNEDFDNVEEIDLTKIVKKDFIDDSVILHAEDQEYEITGVDRTILEQLK